MRMVGAINDMTNDAQHWLGVFEIRCETTGNEVCLKINALFSDRDLGVIALNE